MLDLGTTRTGYHVEPPAVTLWHCSKCDALVIIRAAKVVDDPFCPACAGVTLDYCGDMNSIPGLSFGAA